MQSSFSLKLMLISFTVGSFADLQFFPDGLVSDNTVSGGCEAALTANVTSCPEAYLMHPIGDFGGPFDNTTSHDIFCSEACSTALVSYQSSVTSACVSDLQPWEGIPANYSGNRMAAYQTRMCLKDPTTNEYCMDFFANYTMPDTIASITDLPQDYKCSACYLNFLQAMQATPYSNYDESWVEDYQAIQQSCGISYPTAVQPWPLNVTQDIPANFISPNTTENTYCLSGNTVVVESGSNCQSIAEANGVSTGTLRVINGLFPDCSNLIAGVSICLPMACSTYKVQSGDTCYTISDALDDEITITDLISYNPTLNSLCGNLKADENICIFPAAGQFTATIIPGVTPVQTDVYATATIAPPGATAIDTTAFCGRYYQVMAGDSCEQISLNNTITADLFMTINPSINSTCGNLFPGLYYCVMPTEDWDQAASIGSSITISAPAPTQSGTTGSCYRWYTVKADDGCDFITSSYGLTFVQFQAWNKGLLSDCSNLILGDAYCVKGSDYLLTSAITSTSFRTSSTSISSKTPATSTATSSSSIPGPTQTGISPLCSKYVAQTDGVYCYDMAAAASISLAQLYYWNPALNDDCTGLYVGFAYCIGISPPGPVQAGIVNTCESYALQAEGVYCYDMAAAAGISLDNFYLWNPALNGDCSGLWSGYAYCVASA